MKKIFESWNRFLKEQMDKLERPEYTLPISMKELMLKINQFIVDNKLQPKGSSKKKKAAIAKENMVCHPTFGLCFDIATLVQHMAGGKLHSGLKKMRLKKFTYMDPETSKRFDDEVSQTTHWYLQDREGSVIDPTSEQFTFGVRPPYEQGRSGDFGTPHFGDKSRMYAETVPSKTVLKFAKLFKEWNKQTNKEDRAYGRDWWLNEAENLGISY